MIPRINLLPHRERERKAQQVRFIIMLVMVGLVAAGISFVIDGYLHQMQLVAQSRITFLEQEVQKINKEITHIEQVKVEINDMLSREKVVESLQLNRAQVVHLFDQLGRHVPENLVLKSVKQTGTKLVIVGSTNSQSKVSVFMRNLETSQHLKNATLIEIQSSGSGDNDFTINVDFLRTDDTPSKV